MTVIATDIAKLRMTSQRLNSAPLETPAQVVEWLTAVQAQDFAGAKWALGIRMARALESDVERAFNDGEILRTHAMRPTWHFVSPDDIRWLQQLTGPRVHAVNGSMYRTLELDAGTLRQAHVALEKGLGGGHCLTREELRRVIEEAGITAGSGLRLAYIVMAAELDGLLCSGPRRGKQFTYALLEERAPAARARSRDEALSELTLRYFRSRGPATVHDFAKWSGLTVADGRLGLDAVAGHLEKTVLDGLTYWAGEVAATSPQAPHGAHLLSIYDEYVSSYKDRSAIGEQLVGAQLQAMGNALQFITVVRGQVVGTWKRTMRRSEVAIDLNPLTVWTEADRSAVAEAAEQYGRFLELPVVLS